MWGSEMFYQYGHYLLVIVAVVLGVLSGYSFGRFVVAVRHKDADGKKDWLAAFTLFFLLSMVAVLMILNGHDATEVNKMAFWLLGKG